MLKVAKNPQIIARAVLQAEADAIRDAIDRLDDQFDLTVDAILNTTGRVVVSGVGKSALIGQKIVATMNSTGTPALFMHAADAIHGDLGMIQSNDIVLLLSKSGNTAEIKGLLPMLRDKGVKLIALVGDRNSVLGRQADFVLHAYAACEADSLNLAPTTSTTVALAIGDALAVSLLEVRGFTRQDFARYHPGGSLGKKLYMKVADIFPHHGCPTVSEHTLIKDVILEISAKRLGATAVLHEDGTLAGVITDGDIRRTAAAHTAFWELTAADIMTTTPVHVDPDTFATNALQLMEDRNISQLVVYNKNKVLGFVHLHDLLREGII